MRLSYGIVFVCLLVAVLAQRGGRQQRVMDREARRLLRRNRSLIPAFVRMIFHDCVGGCDGCIDVTSPSNAGLAPTVQEAEQFRQRFASSLSQADVNAFLGTRALEEGARLAGGSVSVTFRPGRRDCDRNTTPARNVPEGNILNPIEFLQGEFGLSSREAVALLGCHSLGRMRTANSGFDGPWDATETTLDNGYFLNMNITGWQHKQVNNAAATSTQWDKRGQFTMLIADMIILKKFTISGEFDTPSCQYDSCPFADTAGVVFEYAASQRPFHRDISTAFQKMIDH